ncbi:hypothetical protein KP509_15G016600 [Ceratopteris richardii]|uniref:PARP catalytic domain-containing protein n=1 Tax=Ceratopteris richardii TaxID=49495 RepID=A0A8T2T5L5_CERRI|nr:hypothetical protein KP509_15G016600 [Ceratopteris richardii]
MVHQRSVGIVSQGFDQSRRQSNGSVYDPGIYLSPEGNVFLSAMYSDADEQGIQYILLCKMIMGKMEQLPKGGEKFSPSTEDYDTGVDDLRQPSQYVVQSTKTNTHVLPIFIITFKLSTCWQCLLLAMQRASDSSVPCCLSCKQPPSTTRQESKATESAADFLIISLKLSTASPTRSSLSYIFPHEPLAFADSAKPI